MTAHPAALRRFAAGTLGIALLCGGCDAAAHLASLQPSLNRAPVTAAMVSPSVGSPAGPGSSFQRGVDIDFYAWRGENVTESAASTVRYITGILHANAVSISFPFFMNGVEPGSVHATASTPKVRQLSALVMEAENARLRVSLRPLLDQPSLGRSRVRWIPANLAAWFASYQAFLRPYAVMAQRDHVAELIVGTELDGFDQSAGWASLDQVIRRWYAGRLACADNWDAVVTDGCGPAVVQDVDAYPPATSGDQLDSSWLAYDKALPAGTVETEVGIAAAAGAWRQPWQVRWPVPVADTALQRRWFAAACHAAVSTGLGGIYFWSLSLDTSPPAPPTLTSQTSLGGPGAAAIARCFAAIERTAR